MPVIADLLRERPTLEFHMFGNTPRPKAWDEFGPRIVETPIVADYSAFRSTLARLGWSIGIAPLLKIPFNLGKTNLKWVDYSSAGIAVVASRDTLYDECSADGCGMLADTPDEWRAALSFLLDNPDARVAQVRRAQERLMQDYSAWRCGARCWRSLTLRVRWWRAEAPFHSGTQTRDPARPAVQDERRKLQSATPARTHSCSRRRPSRRPASFSTTRQVMRRALMSAMASAQSVSGVMAMGLPRMMSAAVARQRR